MMTAVTKLALGLLATTTVAADSRLNLRFSPLLISSLVAATADAAYLRKAETSRDSNRADAVTGTTSRRWRGAPEI